MKTRKNHTIPLSFFLSVFFITVGLNPAAEALNPDAIIPVSAEKEKRMGASISEQVEKKFESVDDPLVEKRFEEIGNKLAKVCDRQDLIYRFKVLKAKKGEKKENYYNAFTLPGGYVYIFEPLMELMQTDDRLAAIIAHELGHNCARHVVKRVQGSLGANLLMLLAVFTSRDGREVAKANKALNHLMMSYSREDEFEADRLSVKYVKAAGFNPQGVVESLLVLQKVRKEGHERKYMIYKTHPYLSERIANAKTELNGYRNFDSYINLPEEKDGYY